MRPASLAVEAASVALERVYGQLRTRDAVDLRPGVAGGPAG
ncbi:hypothetical protein [Streptomyces sp. PSAA01]|nr:hypothetical protein [Streptomyces sp. PSAA01]